MDNNTNNTLAKIRNGVTTYIGAWGHTWTSNIDDIGTHWNNKSYGWVALDVLYLMYVLPEYSWAIALFHTRRYERAVEAAETIGEDNLPALRKPSVMRKVGWGCLALAVLGLIGTLAGDDNN